MNAKTEIDPYVSVKQLETQEEIDVCLNCPLPESKCHGTETCFRLNEITGSAIYKSARKKAGKFNEEKFLYTIKTNMSAANSAKFLGVSERTVRKWKQNYRDRLRKDGEDPCDGEKEVEKAPDGEDI